MGRLRCIYDSSRGRNPLVHEGDLIDCLIGAALTGIDCRYKDRERLARLDTEPGYGYKVVLGGPVQEGLRPSLLEAELRSLGGEVCAIVKDIQIQIHMEGFRHILIYLTAEIISEYYNIIVHVPT